MFSKQVEESFALDAADLARAAKATNKRERPASSAINNTSAPITSKIKWSQFATAQVLEDEIKRQATELAGQLSSAARFKSGDHLQAASNFTLIAALFGIVREHDQRVRWQQSAGEMQASMQAAAIACRQGNELNYRQATAHLEQLEGVLRGEQPESAKSRKVPVLSQRTALMQRLDRAYAERMVPWTAEQREFTRRREALAHEAQIVAVLGELLTRGQEDHSQEAEYQTLARSMQNSAIAAAEAKTLTVASTAVSKMDRACADCHVRFRD